MTVGRPALRFVTIALAAACAAVVESPARAQRAVGIDVSAWQGTINWPTVAAPVAQGGGGKQFAFIRATRGGTTGFYNQSDPNNTQGLNTLSQRYDDPFFVSNITQATANGLFAGPYHFARPDIIETTLNSNGIANTGWDEANHFLEIAGPYMKPGYLLPVFDLEAGQSERTSSQLSAFAVEFSNRIFEVKGVRPLIYINQNYANYVNSTVPAAFPNLWIARWPNQSNPDAIDIQNGDPPPSPPSANVYGRWNPTFPTIPDPQPWEFWQYASTIKVPGIGGGTQNVDGNVFQGTIEELKEFLVPALWMSDASGSWSDATRWNSNPGLPAAIDRVIINRPNAAVTVTLAGGNHTVRSVQTNEALLQTGGTLNVQQYTRLLANSTFSGGALNTATLENTSTLNQAGGAIVVNAAVTGAGNMLLSGGTFSAARIQQNSLTMNGPATLRLAAAGTTSVSVVNVLSPGAGQIDVGNEALVVNYTGASPAPLIRSALAGGYAAGAWNGSGINSSAAAADASGRTAVGFAEATDIGSPATWLGQPVDITSILIRHTLYGDTNLSGAVDLADFSRVAAAFNTAVPRWSFGDFDYDGVVTLADFSLLAANYNQALPSDLARPGAIPEPATAGALALALLIARRRG